MSWLRKPSAKEAACRKDMTVPQRIADFWFYHKFHLLAAVFCIAAVAICVSQCAKNEAADVTVGLYLNETVTGDRLKVLQGVLDDCAKDHNGDGKAIADLYDFSYAKSGGYSANAESQRSQLLAELSSGKTLLYVTDATRSREFSERKVLAENAEQQGTAFTVDFDSALGQRLKEFHFREQQIVVFLRETDGFTVEKVKDFAESQAAARELFEALRQLNASPAQ